ncbi:MAG: HEAT repeat domain-containing protein [Planctomycetota bacterium]|nr:HEAT repeat domain-containing protein [Planctomycetota bacterium]
MKKIVVVLLILFAFNQAVIFGEDVLPDLLGALNHKDPQVRENAATMLGTLKIKSAVRPLIDSLSDDNERVRIEAHKSLVKVTKENLPAEQKQWLDWWEKSGKSLYATATFGTKELTKLKAYLNVAFIVMVVEIVFIIIFIMVFSFMGGAKIKEMKEINRRAEHYIADAEGVSRRFEELIEGIERRRNETISFFDKLRDDTTVFVNKLREDNQNEIERFADMVHQNLEHSLRESSKNLREKSEAELRQTFTLLKQDLEELIRKTVAEQIEKIQRSNRSASS